MRQVLAIILALTGAAQPALAADPDYLGTWVIAGVRPAPWLKSRDELDTKEQAHLVGSAVTYGKTRIEGLAPLACDKPDYEMLDVPPEGLFQGALTAPREQAAALGFTSTTIPTLETGCEGWIAFHFVDGGTALFALNNTIYTLRRPAKE